MSWLRQRPRWVDLPVAVTAGKILTGTGNAKICIEPGGRAVLQLNDVGIQDGTGAGVLFTAAELAGFTPLPPGATGFVGHLVGSLSVSTLKAAGSLFWISATNGISAPSSVRNNFTLRGEMSWHIGG